MIGVKGLLYPVCFLKNKEAYCASIFLSEMTVVAPSEDSIDHICQKKEIDSMKISSIVPAPLGDKLEEFKNGLKALKKWGEQMDLGKTVGFETLYSSLSQKEHEDIQSIMSVIKGEDEKDLMMMSRLFLRLSIDTDRQMDDLEEELERVEGEASKISELVDGQESMAKTAESKVKNLIEPLDRARERLKAWARLLFASESRYRFECWPVGVSISVKDLMDSAYESISKGKSCMELAQFSLPLNLKRVCQGEMPVRIKALFSQLLDQVSSNLTWEKARLIKESEDVQAICQEINNVLDNSCSTTDQEGLKMMITLYPDYPWENVAIKAAQLNNDVTLVHSLFKNRPYASIYMV